MSTYMYVSSTDDYDMCGQRNANNHKLVFACNYVCKAYYDVSWQTVNYLSLVCTSVINVYSSNNQRNYHNGIYGFNS